jgi:hypothetical protein
MFNMHNSFTLSFKTSSGQVLIALELYASENSHETFHDLAAVFTSKKMTSTKSYPFLKLVGDCGSP